MLSHVKCSRCGEFFTSYNPTPQFCSRACKDAAQCAAINGAKALELYQSGLTQAEVAAELGTTQKVIWGTLARLGVKCRVAAKRQQTGEKNASWRGDDATYAALHSRVRAARGAPAGCEACGETDGRFEWANQTGNYASVADYKSMCVKCHKAFDAGRRQSTGKPTSKHVAKNRKEVIS